ncbi:MAG: hypothetical protein JNL21_12395 [Myxococcales bacterium]|nr:hypothetical protein [Myxococcales bacterium]
MERSAALPAFALVLLGCSAQASPRAAAEVDRPPASAAVATSEQSSAGVAARTTRLTTCPSFNRRARVIARPITEGAELLFWTPDDTSALRQRVSALSLPSEVVASAQLRTDNIHQGVRFVFAPKQPSDTIALRLAVHDYARDIARDCGLRFAPPKAKRQESRPDAPSSSPAPSSPKPRADSKSAAPPQKKPKATTAAPAAPKPASSAPASSASAAPPAAPIADPFKPPLPPAPKPPPNPFR